MSVDYPETLCPLPSSFRSVEITLIYPFIHLENSFVHLKYA